MKTSLVPGSQVVAEYLEKSGLQEDLDKIGFNLGRFRLHHLHWQFRAAAAGNFRGDQRERSGGRRGALGQSQFRRSRERGRARQLSRFAAARRRLCHRRLDECRPGEGAARRRSERQKGLPERHLAVEQGDRRIRCQERHPADLRQEIRRRVQGRRQLAQDNRQGWHDLRVGRANQPTCRTRPISSAWASSQTARGHRRRARARTVPQLDHHRPHFAGRFDQEAIRRPANT